MYLPTFDPEKFQNLMLYASDRAVKDGDQYFGAVKLNKLLYYVDFISFQRFGTPITGATYQKLREGPAPRELLRQREILVDTGKAEIKPFRVFNYVQNRLLPTSTVVPSKWFSPDELTVIDEVIAEFEGMTAAQVSEMSHKEAGWVMADEGEVIPYETALLDPIFGDGSSELLMKRNA